MPTQKKTILLVEDDASLSSLAKFGLEEKGYRVLTAYNGEEALDHLKSEKPDLIWLDLYLPKMNGMEFLEKLKQNKEDCHIPVIVVTVSHSKAEIAKSVEGVNVCGYFLKSEIKLKDIIAQMGSIMDDCNKRKKA